MSALAPASPRTADATGVLYERYAGRIFGYCLSLLGSREDAEDAVQTTFVNAQRGLRRGVVPKFELAWLFKIARNVCYNTHAASARRGRVESAHDLDALQDLLASPERGGGVTIGDLTRALSAIPERQRRALLLREFQGLSYEEMAVELGVTVAAVETLLFRARRAVTEQLELGGTTRVSSVLSSFAGLFRWFFQGGAAPLKIAAATATVATTATLAISPIVSGHHHSPASVTPRAGTAGVVRGPVRTSRAVVPGDLKRTPVRRHGIRASDASASTAPSVRHESVPPAAKTPAGSASSPVNSVPTAVTAPSVTLPTVTVPAVAPPTTVTVPQVLLPAVQPPIDLPLGTPALPDLPKLP